MPPAATDTKALSVAMMGCPIAQNTYGEVFDNLGYRYERAPILLQTHAIAVVTHPHRESVPQMIRKKLQPGVLFREEDTLSREPIRLPHGATVERIVYEKGIVMIRTPRGNQYFLRFSAFFATTWCLMLPQKICSRSVECHFDSGRCTTMDYTDILLHFASYRGMTARRVALTKDPDRGPTVAALANSELSVVVAKDPRHFMHVQPCSATMAYGLQVSKKDAGRTTRVIPSPLASKIALNMFHCMARVLDLRGSGCGICGVCNGTWKCVDCMRAVCHSCSHKVRGECARRCHECVAMHARKKARRAEPRAEPPRAPRRAPQAPRGGAEGGAERGVCERRCE